MRIRNPKHSTQPRRSPSKQKPKPRNAHRPIVQKLGAKPSEPRSTRPLNKKRPRRTKRTSKKNRPAHQPNERQPRPNNKLSGQKRSAHWPIKKQFSKMTSRKKQESARQSRRPRPTRPRKSPHFWSMPNNYKPSKHPNAVSKSTTSKWTSR